MAIKNRQGKSQDFVPTKLVSGEFAVVQEGDENTADGSALYLATKAGSVKRIPFASEVEDLQSSVDDAVEDAREAIASAIDPTLTQSGKAADAKKTGDEIAELKSDLSELAEEVETYSGLSNKAKVALLNCFAHVGWTDEHGQTYYDALEVALRENEYPMIKATFNAGTNKIYNVYTVDDIKKYLTVTYYETSDSEGVNVSQNSFTVSGMLKSGESVVTVHYQEYKARVAIQNIIDFYNVHHWNTEQDSDVFTVLPRGTFNGTIEGTTLRITTVDTVEYPEGNNRRMSAWMKCGKVKAYNKDFTISDYYAIPVPDDAVGVSVTITPSNYKFNTMFRRQDNEHYIYGKLESGWQVGSYAVESIPSDDAYGTTNMILLNTQGVASVFAEGDPVFDVTFTTA